MNLRFLCQLRFFSILILFPLFSAFSQDELDRKIGQMVGVGFTLDRNFMDALFYNIDRNLGCVILFAHNIESQEQIKNLTFGLQSKARIPLLIAADQEGGRVARLDENNGFGETKTPYRLGTEIDNEFVTRSQALLMAEWLYDSGINTNLAPVVDVNVNPSSPAIGYYERSFSSNPYKVYDHANWFYHEFKNFNIICTLKHFPGHGSAVGDSHYGLTDVTTTWADSELVPYREFISAGYSDLIMVGHLFNTNLDSIYPASLSRNTITGLLRDSLRFQGVVVSDDMQMGALGNYTFDEKIELAINAGTDILLYSNYYRPRNPHLAAEIIRTIRQKVDNGLIPLSRIDESYQRIMDLKNRVTGLALRSVRTIPDKFSMHVFPNPFNVTTTIELVLTNATPAEINIYDITGKCVYSNRYARLLPGKHIVTFDGGNLSSGVYILRFKTSSLSQVKKLTLLK